MTACSFSTYTDSAKRVSDIEGGLRVTLSIESDEALLGDAIPIHLSLHNVSESHIPFLPINTAFEEPLSADVFDVMHDDESQPYLGIVSRRLPPVAEDVLMIGPDERLERTIDLVEFYQIDQVGEYRIRYVPRKLVVGAELDFELEAVVIESDQLMVTVR